MTVYVIAQLTIHDRDGYSRYEDGFMEVFEKFDGTMLSVDEEPMVLEGQFTATRSVLIEFPTQEQALTWMQSPEYKAIARHRVAASVANSILVRGFDPEAPFPGK